LPASGQSPDDPPPARLQSLVDEGLIDAVLRQLMSGKQANAYVVRCGDQLRVAKGSTGAANLSSRQAVDYTYDRKVKSSRKARAITKGTHQGQALGREAQEAFSR
jgi:RIO kinase 1